MLAGPALRPAGHKHNRDEASKAYADATRATMAQQWQQAHELDLMAWRFALLNGEALMEVGLAAARMGKKDEAQRLYDQAVEEWETVTGKRVAVDTTDVPSGGVGAVAWSGDTIAIAHGRYVSLLDPANLRERLRLHGHTEALTSVAFSPDGAWLASGSEDHDTILWRTSDWTRVATLRSLRDASAGIVFTPDGYVDFVGPDADTVAAAIDRPYLSCRIGNLWFPFAVCARRFRVTGLLAKAMVGDTSYRAA